jgi:hypothetical protein
MQYRSDALRVVSADYLGQANQRDGPNPGRTLATASHAAVISLGLAGRILTLSGAECAGEEEPPHSPSSPGIGVTMHLGLDAVTATLATVVGCPPGIWIVLACNQLQAVLQGPEAQAGPFLPGSSASWASRSPVCGHPCPGQATAARARIRRDHPFR